MYTVHVHSFLVVLYGLLTNAPCGERVTRAKQEIREIITDPTHVNGEIHFLSL
jgi:hypothetical protein